MRQLNPSLVLGTLLLRLIATQAHQSGCPMTIQVAASSQLLTAVLELLKLPCCPSLLQEACQYVFSQ